MSLRPVRGHYPTTGMAATQNSIEHGIDPEGRRGQLLPTVGSLGDSSGYLRR
ncbi:MAG: hypothetical protein RML92_01820 [Bacteroidia bacterium]|nr:hypothetical protein [Bacteroidia bacterium]